MANSIYPVEEDPDDLLSFDDKFIMIVGAALLTILILVVAYVTIAGYLANVVFANVTINTI